MRTLVPEGDDVDELLDRPMLGGRGYTQETQRRRKDGSIVHVALTVSPRHDAEGRVVGLSTVARDISHHKRVEEQRERLLTATRELARTDQLTGLANRRAWDEELRAAVRRSENDGRPLCIALLDLDRFKLFNDERGHPAGDRFLREAAVAWRAALRDGDLIARYGGEEFGILLADCTLDQARVIVERLRSSTPGEETASAGLAAWDRGEPVAELIARADAALYEAKDGGRDRLLTADPTASTVPAERLAG
jgi:diguanylate cyclase (GGDEF)-like protein